MKNFVNLTEKAKQYLLNACISENYNNVRLEVVGGGCAGFSYEYKFSNEVYPLDIEVNLDDTHKFVIDNTSLLYVVGTEIDYIQKLGSSSLVISNPNESSSCGCGKSFSVG